MKGNLFTDKQIVHRGQDASWGQYENAGKIQTFEITKPGKDRFC
jgi:hypothetical protein